MASQFVSKIFQSDLEEILIQIIRNSPSHRKKIKSSHFYSVSNISIPLKTYVQRIIAYLSLTDEHFILSLKYFEKIMNNCNYDKKQISIHKMLFACLMAADKFLEDDPYSCSFYSKAAGIKPEELLKMEIEFYEAINFELYISEEEFSQIKEKLLGIENISDSDSDSENKSLNFQEYINKDGIECA